MFTNPGRPRPRSTRSELTHDLCPEARSLHSQPPPIGVAM